MSFNINYGYAHMPKIVRSLDGSDPAQRTTIKLPGLDSAALYLGAFVPFVKANGTLNEFGIGAIADDDYIGGIVVGFTAKNGILPIQDDANRAGTLTNATGNLPMKYTFASTNDQSNTTSAKMELVEVLPIKNTDVIEVALWGASTSPVVRGTTTAEGTTTSSANAFVGMSVSTTYHFALLESTAAATSVDMDFVTVLLDGKQPTNPYHVYAMPVRTQSGFASAAS